MMSGIKISEIMDTELAMQKNTCYVAMASQVNGIRESQTRNEKFVGIKKLLYCTETSSLTEQSQNCKYTLWISKKNLNSKNEKLLIPK